MSAEYDGKMDRGTDNVSKTIKVFPKPPTRPDQRIRALMVTGDETGVRDASFDDGMVLQGLDPYEMHYYEQMQQALINRFQGIDQAFYD